MTLESDLLNDVLKNKVSVNKDRLIGFIEGLYEYETNETSILMLKALINNLKTGRFDNE